MLPVNEVDLPLNFDKNLNREIKRIIDDVYAGNIITGNIDARLLKLVGSAVESQVISGYGKSFAKVDYTTPDAEMLTRLTRDVWQFSAAKNYQQLRDTTLALIDESGKVRSFADFKDAAKKINGQYNQTWLKVEYDQALGASTMASRWAEFKANADTQPYLKYSTVGDDNVRAEHELLNGIVRKISGEFWKQYFPPNGWRCRCSADQLAGSTAVETKDIPNVPVPQMFRTNLAEKGLVFPEGHAYYEGVPKTVLYAAIQTLPDEVAYKSVYVNQESKGSVKMHLLHGITEMEQNIAIGKILADDGYKVKLLPILSLADDELRKQLYKTEAFFPGKNPDALVNNELFEFTGLENTDMKHLSGKIKDKAMRNTKQANNLIVKLTNGMNNFEIQRVVNGKFNISKSLNKVWVINGKELIKMQNPNYKK